MIVYELQNCGNHVDLYQTEQGAKDDAQRILDGYHDLYADLDDEEREGSEPLTTEELEWTVERIDHHGLPTDDPNWGWERMIARYSEKNGWFVVKEREVKP